MAGGGVNRVPAQGGPISSGAVGPISAVEGDTPHHEPDLITSAPVKVGGHANVGLRGAVHENDRVDASYTLTGAARVQVSGPLADVVTDTAAIIAAAGEGSVVLGTKDPTMGLTTDAAVVTNDAGTVSAKLRGLLSRASTTLQGLFVVGNVAHDDPDSNNPIKIGGRASSAPPLPVANADRVNAWFTTQGALVVSTTTATSTSPERFQNLSTSADAVVKAASGQVFGIQCHNRNAAARYFQLHNILGAIPGGAAPFYVTEVPPNTTVVVGDDLFSSLGINFSTGIRFGFSTTENTFTAGAAGDQTTHIMYR